MTIELFTTEAGDFALGKRRADEPSSGRPVAVDFLGGAVVRDPIGAVAPQAFPPVIDVEDLAPPIGFIILGGRTADYSGGSVSNAGDVNGDGLDDIIIGASGGYPGYNYNGRAYVIYGKTDGFGTIDLRNLPTTDGFVIEGPSFYSSAGESVSSAGDINGDGFDDLIVGTPGRYGGGNLLVAETYVVFGREGGYNKINLAALTPAQGFAIEANEMGDKLGYGVSSAGDVNGDGFDDIIIGAERGDRGGENAGEAYVIFGHAGAFADIDLGAPEPGEGFVILGAAPGYAAGRAISSTGDVNGDGFDDIIIGAGAGPGSPGPGAAYVLFGKAGGFGTVDLGALTPADGFVIEGDAVGDAAGRGVSSAGDVNGDGFGDVIVGAPFNDDGGAGAGAAYVIFGKAGGFGAIDLGDLGAADGFAIRAGAAERLGYSVSSAGDVNGDGFDDVIISATGGSPDIGYEGAAYVVFGKAGGPGDIDLTNLAVDDGFRIDGSQNFSFFGESVSSAGDIDGDGFDDLLIGDSGAGGRNRISAGETYVIFGQAPDEAVKRVGSVADQAIRGGDFGDTLVGQGGDDTLAGGGGRDRLKGGAGADDFFLAGADPADADKILDFGGNDRIALDGDTFGLVEGALPASRFVIGDSAQDADDRLIYDDATGKLFVDADGTGAEAQVQIARLADAPTIASSDFIVI